MRLKLKEGYISPTKVTAVYRAINDGLDTEDVEEIRNYLQQIVDYCISYANDYNITLSYSEDYNESDEATQPSDIAKKEEYKKLVTPDFKRGKSITE